MTGLIPISGGTVAVPGGASLTVDSGTVAAPVMATITAQAPVDSPTQAWPADPVGPAWVVDLGGVEPAKPVTLSISFDSAALPAGADPAEVMLAYQDAASGSWTPVPATVDPAAHTVSASVGHLSTWGLFTIDWDYWLGFIAKAASGNVTDLLGALGTLTTACAEQSSGFGVDNSATNGIIKGCVQNVAKGTATIGVTNMRAISFALSGGALDPSTPPILDAGDTVTFKAGGTKLAQPLVAQATLSPLALGYQLTDITLRMLPGSDVFTKAGIYGKVLAAVATAEAKAWSSATILAKLQQSPPDIAGAAEEAVSVLTGKTFMEVFVAAAVKAGGEYGVPYLSALTTARLKQILLAVNLVVLDTTVLSWDVQYVLAAYGAVKVTWAVPPPAPTKVTTQFDWTSCPGGGSAPCAIYIRWHDASSRESGYRIYVRKCVYSSPPDEIPICSGFSSRYTLVKTLPSNRTAFEAFNGVDFPPEGRYYVAAFDAAGESSRILAGNITFGY